VIRVPAAAAVESVGNPLVNLSIFAVFVAVTLVLVIRVSGSNRTAADYYAGGRAFSGRQNGIDSLFWRNFTTRGALWSIYGGLGTAIGLILFSPVVSGKVDPATGASLSMIKDVGIDFSWFPLENPGIVAIPIAFLLGWLGSISGSERPDSRRFARMEVRSLTGAGAVKTRHQ
jgi:Na+(H+)/acetate symporter ActP